MNTKLTAIIAVVIVVAAGAAAAVFMLGGGNGGNDGEKENLRLYIYGNANGDNNLDDKDVSTLKDIIKNGTWDQKANPYADATQDGKIDEDDVKAVENFIAGKSQKMFYMSSEWGVRDLMFPLDPSKTQSPSTTDSSSAPSSESTTTSRESSTSSSPRERSDTPDSTPCRT